MNRPVKVGEGTVIADDVQFGRDVVIGHHVVIHSGVIIGDSVVIGDHAVLGVTPTRARTSTLKVGGELPPLVVGNGCRIGVGAVIYRGSTIGEETFIADSAQVRERCNIGRYVIIGRGVTVENDSLVGDRTRIQTGAYITAYSTLEDNVFIAPMVTTTNDNYVGRTKARFSAIRGVIARRGARIGANATILPGIEIGEDALVAAGAVVTRPVPPRQVVMGVPARVVRPVPPEQLLDAQPSDDFDKERKNP